MILLLLKSIIIKKVHFSYYLENHQWRVGIWERYKQKEQFRSYCEKMRDEFVLHPDGSSDGGKKWSNSDNIYKLHHNLLMNWMWRGRGRKSWMTPRFMI